MGLTDFWDLLVKVFQTLPPAWQAGFAPCLVSMLVTQWIKVRRIGKISNRNLETIAFLIAFVPVIILHPSFSGVLAATVAGLTSPILFKIIKYVLKAQFPKLFDDLNKV
jgi:hypothetical protein